MKGGGQIGSDTILSLPDPPVCFLAARSHIIFSPPSPLVFMLLLLSVPSSWGSLRWVFLALYGFMFLPILSLVRSHSFQVTDQERLLSIIWKP